MTRLTDQARQLAQDTVLANGSSIGLLGASSAYKQVWARDSMVCALGLMLCGPEGADIARRSVDTLAAYQSRLGNIPHNVGFVGLPDPALIAHGGALHAGNAQGVVVDSAHAGCIDNSLWFIVGNAYLWRLDGDLERIRRLWPALQRAYTWLEYQDSNECGLLEVHEAMDWADLFANRYNSLGPNVLWYAAQRSMAGLAAALGEPDEAYTARAEDIRFKLNTLLWYGPETTKDMAWIEANRKEWLYPVRLASTVLQERPYFLPYMAFRDYADRFDSFGNLLAVLLGVTDAAQSARILDYIESAGINLPWPVRAVDPPVLPGEADWREYYRLRNLNLPHQYHNGGAWPYLGGLYVAALVQAGRHDEAAFQLERLAEMNRQSRTPGLEWDFNEWCHGVSGRPSGFRGQSWSAAMYVYAHECVQRRACPGFGGPW
ncbi:glycogen debranching protein [Deinococcus irradiatisoli]|uniref:Glycogen debranching protein n=1 Tax=Deinococcus irradiatisoli TaxID=2202254 RepID=A0A2Z3JAE0_9DEIO|nr:glycoside hydrolase 100 family protein [Deinococcus irradiatisoli]AWN21962.1 glycogen debranching protein [Deinococcus irradiatisoli]